MSILNNSLSLLARLSSVGFYSTKNSFELLRQPGILNRMQPAIRRQILEIQKRTYFTHQLCKNINYLTNNSGTQLKVNPSTMKLDVPIGRPLCLMLCWLGSTPKQVGKYAEIYLEQGYDLVTVRVSTFECFFPETGALQAFRNLVNFLEANNNFDPIILHSFSIGAFMWGEILQIVKEDPERFESVVNRIKVQIWDSTADSSKFQIGVSKAIFPNNSFLEKMLLKYLTFHQKIFYDVSTKYYERASVSMTKNICKSNALIMYSNTDLVGTPIVNKMFGEAWKKLGTNVTYQGWDKSPHVQHYRSHPEEYLISLGNFLEINNLLLNKPAMEHKIEMIKLKKKI